MTSRIVFFLLSLTVPLVTFASYRPIDIKKELQRASFVGEIEFLGYDSTYVSLYSDGFHPTVFDSTKNENARVGAKDSVWVISKIFYRPISIEIDSIYTSEILPNITGNQYIQRPHILPRNGISNGFWPKEHDTCIIIINGKNQVSVFGIEQGAEYVFWDPYFNSGLNTVFVFDDNFRFFGEEGKNSSNNRIMASTADFFQKKYACQYHCSVRTESFWTLLDRIRNN